MNASGETRKGFPLTLPLPCDMRGCEQQNLRVITKRNTPSDRMGYFFLEMYHSTGELAASTCAKRVKSRGEAGLLRMATAIRGMPGSEFEPRRPLQKHHPTGGVFLCAPQRSPSCQPAAGGYRSRQPGHFLESASLHPPQAALRCFPRRPLQVKELRFSNNFVEKRSSSYLQSLDLSRFCR